MKINIPSMDTLIIDFNNLTAYSLKTISIATIQAIFIYYLWNWSLPELINGINYISYVQSILLMLLVKVLSRAWVGEGLVNLVNQQTAGMVYTNEILTNIGNNLYFLASNTNPSSEIPNHENTSISLENQKIINSEKPIDIE